MLKSKKRTVMIAVIAALVVLAILLAYFLRNRGSDPNQPVSAGQNVVVTVTANSFADMYGYQFQLHYNKDALEYTKQLTSQLDEITTIFGKSFSGYELIGATMIGEVPGVSGRNQAVCEVVFTAKEDGVLSDYNFSIRDVRVVTSELAYLENIKGWKITAKIQDQE